MSANFRPETLLELTERGNVAVVCRCGRRSVLDGPKLARYFMARQWCGRLHMVSDHLRCAVCGSRGGQIGLTLDKPTTDFGPRDDREWKRMAARLRG